MSIDVFAPNEKKSQTARFACILCKQLVRGDISLTVIISVYTYTNRQHSRFDSLPGDAYNIIAGDDHGRA